MKTKINILKDLPRLLFSIATLVASVTAFVTVTFLIFDTVFFDPKKQLAQDSELYRCTSAVDHNTSNSMLKLTPETNNAVMIDFILRVMGSQKQDCYEIYGK